MGSMAYLKPNERKALEEFSKRLEETLGNKVVKAWFFGSKARGDFEPDSDIDVLVILNPRDWDTVEQVSFIGADVSLEHDVLINTHSLSKERWEEMKRFKATLWREIQRDGVPLIEGVGERDEGGGEETG